MTEIRLAVLIDADNVSADHVKDLMDEIAKLGRATVRRMYGDWTSNQLAKWKAVALDFALQPQQQYAYTAGKNATDSALIIDAMDLLHRDGYEGFCIVSSDSDFTPLASRLRAAGAMVYGFGAKKTPSAFVNSCDRFTYLEVLASTAVEPRKRPPTNKLQGDTKLVDLLRKGIEGASDEDGWAHLGGIGSQIRNQAPDFDSRAWGYAKLGDLVEAVGLFEIKTAGNNQKIVRIPRS
jgi:uncharacterized LabA/DUF88 family protein